jgi:hypothetical protein
VEFAPCIVKVRKPKTELTVEAVAAIRTWAKAKQQFDIQYGTLADLARKHGISQSYARNIVCVFNLGGDLT